MITNNLPIVAFFKNLLDPFIIWGMLIVTTWFYDEDFTSYYFILVVLTYFISTYIYERILIFRNWRRDQLLSYISDILMGWSLIVGILAISRLCH